MDDEKRNDELDLNTSRANNTEQENPEMGLNLTDSPDENIDLGHSEGMSDSEPFDLTQKTEADFSPASDEQADPEVDHSASSEDLDSLLEDGLGLPEENISSEDDFTPDQDLQTEIPDEQIAPTQPKKSKKGLVLGLALLVVVGGGAYVYSTGLLGDADQQILSQESGSGFGTPPMPTPIGREEPLSIGETKEFPNNPDSLEIADDTADEPKVPPFAPPALQTEEPVLDSELDTAVTSDLSLDNPDFLQPPEESLDSRSVDDGIMEIQELPSDRQFVTPTIEQVPSMGLPLDVEPDDVPAPFVSQPEATQEPAVQARDTQRIIQLQNVLNDTREQLSVLTSRLEQLQSQTSGQERSMEQELAKLSRQIDALSSARPSSGTDQAPSRSSGIQRDSAPVRDTVSVTPTLKTPPSSVAQKPLSPRVVRSSSGTGTIAPSTQLPYASAHQQGNAVNWVLKAAQPGIAWLSKEGALQIQQFSVGDTVDGIGVIQSVAQEPDGWVIRGTMGEIRQ